MMLLDMALKVELLHHTAPFIAPFYTYHIKNCVELRESMQHESIVNMGI